MCQAIRPLDSSCPVLKTPTPERGPRHAAKRFSPIEPLLFISIIAAASWPNLTALRKRACDTADIQCHRTLMTILNDYHAVHADHPGDDMRWERPLSAPAWGQRYRFQIKRLPHREARATGTPLVVMGIRFLTWHPRGRRRAEQHLKGARMRLPTLPDPGGVGACGVTPSALIIKAWDFTAGTAYARC
ncbi:hypothetical protein [Deinococcus saxicola]|uniref:hypothetical protein n=1 Tax=Deinococcus saxicola TaxID=249406 RepID=UPI0039EE6864